MKILDLHEIAQLSDAELDEHISELCAEKRDLEQRVGLCASPLGEYIVSRWEKKLEETRMLYGKIPVAGKTDRDIVMVFVEVRAAESHLKTEIEHIKSSSKLLEELDKYYEICKDVCRSREDRVGAKR